MTRQEKREAIKRAVWEGKPMPARRPAVRKPTLYFAGRMRHQNEVAELIGVPARRVGYWVNKGLKAKEIVKRGRYERTATRKERLGSGNSPL